jgi:hypothetical protein
MVLHHFSGMRIFFLKFINFSDSERSEESKALIIKSFRFFASLRMTKREGLPKAIPEKW